MKKKHYLLLFLLFSLLGICLRTVDVLITPIVQMLVIEKNLEVTSIIRLRSGIELAEVIAVAVFICTNVIPREFSTRLDWRIISRFNLLCVIVIFLLYHISQSNIIASWFIWLISTPIECYLCLASFLFGSYDFGSLPFYACVPSILFLYAVLWIFQKRCESIP